MCIVHSSEQTHLLLNSVNLGVRLIAWVSKLDKPAHNRFATHHPTTQQQRITCGGSIWCYMYALSKWQPKRGTHHEWQAEPLTTADGYWLYEQAVRGLADLDSTPITLQIIPALPSSTLPLSYVSISSGSSFWFLAVVSFNRVHSNKSPRRVLKMLPAGWHRLDYILCYHGDYATYIGLTFQLKHPYYGHQKSGISNTCRDNMHYMSIRECLYTYSFFCYRSELCQ